MRYREILKELFDAPLPFTETLNNESFEADFTSQGIKYNVVFMEFPRGLVSDGTAFNLEFFAQTPAGYKTTEIMDSGNSGEVFSTMVAITKRFVHQCDPLVVEFFGGEASRALLYKRMCKRVSTYNPQYEGVWNGKHTFLIRKKLSESEISELESYTREKFFDTNFKPI